MTFVIRYRRDRSIGGPVTLTRATHRCQTNYSLSTRVDVGPSENGSPDPPFLEPQNTSVKYIFGGAYTSRIHYTPHSIFSVHVTVGGVAPSSADREPRIRDSRWPAAREQTQWNARGKTYLGRSSAFISCVLGVSIRSNFLFFDNITSPAKSCCYNGATFYGCSISGARSLSLYLGNALFCKALKRGCRGWANSVLGCVSCCVALCRLRQIQNGVLPCSDWSVLSAN